MDAVVFFAVLIAAVLHASWNAVVKTASDKYLSMTAVVLGHAPLALCLLPFVPTPSATCIPYMIVSTLLHQGYQLFLLWSYRAGDLSQVYPIARGTAPMVVTAVSVLVLGEHLTPTQLAAVMLIGCGIMSLLVVRGHDGLRNPKAAQLALVTSGFIAAYTLCDGLGARVSGSPLGFYAYESIFNALSFAAIIAARKPGLLKRVWPEARMTMLIGGTASFVAYAIAVWAFTQAPIALVAALRETSIVVALLIGVVVMKERLDLSKLVSTFLTTAGTILLRVAK